MTRKLSSKGSIRVLTLIGTLAAFSSWAWAGGPSHVTTGGQPLRWNPATVPFVIDNGPLGSPNCPDACYSRDEAASLVRQAFNLWAGIPTTTIEAQDRGFLSEDVSTPTQFEAYTSGKRPEGNPIIFDDAGAITNFYYGSDSSEILGFATVVPDATGTRYDWGFVLLNGVNTDYPAFFATFVHELGHLLGLDHTQAGYDFVHVWADRPYIPIMFPQLVLNGTESPVHDDISWISWLYPTPNFAQTTGTIKGRIFLPWGEPFGGNVYGSANVVAVLLSPTGEETTEQTSCVSDFLMLKDGAYEIPGLTPGNYAVFIEPLDPEFVGGSGVGPYDSRFTNFVKDYYNGAAESNSDNPDDMTVITVAAGQTVSDINITANEITNRLDLLTDDSEMRYKFPEGFTFPFYGTTYSEVWVNSDGNLTFTKGDGIPGEARSLDRFLSGPPRIAPLFTDLDPGPTGYGNVEASSAPGQITFTWNGVPEFSQSYATPNYFSVTLYSNGDIRFSYTRVRVTADEDTGLPSTWLQAIVGIDPGAQTSGVQTDFSTSLSNRIAAAPIFQVFQDSSFDLEGQEVLFQASENRLMFPFYRGDASTFSGYAVSNHSSEAASVEIKAYGADGALLPFTQNPRTLSIPAGQQIALLGTEIFNIPMSTLQNGWIEMTSETKDLASFFQFGNGLAGPLTEMDGSIAWNTQSTNLYFTRIYDGAGVFPTIGGNLDAITTISVANPNAEAVTVRFTLFDAGGGSAAGPVERVIPAHGMVRERVATLMGVQAPLSAGYVKAEVTQGTGAIGFELIELPDTLLGLNASVGNSSNALYSAQLASGSVGGTGVFTSVKLVNTSTETRVVTITAYDNDGLQLAPPLTNQSLAPNASLQFDSADVFAGFTRLGAPKVGSLVVQADGAGVTGDVVFGEPQRADYAAALPLQSVLLSKAVFSQVTNGTLDPNDLRTDTFTGIALFNPGNTVAEVTLKIFDRNGVQAGGTVSIALQPHQRISDLIENLVAGTSTLVRGYISIESSHPIVAQELFGNAALTFMSAVLPYVTL
jgi:hypothetical protein